MLIVQIKKPKKPQTTLGKQKERNKIICNSQHRENSNKL